MLRILAIALLLFWTAMLMAGSTGKLARIFSESAGTPAEPVGFSQDLDGSSGELSGSSKHFAASTAKLKQSLAEPVRPGAWSTERYFPLLEGKRIAVAGNHSSEIGGVHLVDSLMAAGFDILRVFSPEHGFRGRAADGEIVPSGTDPHTGLEVISLYGRSRRPDAEQLRDVDAVLFDMQDVGVRFYTYISTMTYIMEEAALLGIPVIVLDRPNPHMHYVDGPMMEESHTSFVGLHQVPVVYGMSIGEYALMVNGEGWLCDGLEADLTVIEVENLYRTSFYGLPLPPSPNLPNMTAVYLYPSLCLFEGTPISVGRGTEKPFQIFGHPDLPANTYPYRFRPQSLPASPNPPQLGQLCHGLDLSDIPLDLLQEQQQMNLSYLLEAYRHFPEKESFFAPYFDQLAGTATLRQQIRAGYSEEEIRKSWQEDTGQFQAIRKQYLLYDEKP